ncbi:MAG: hypothetical protein J6F31_03200 [Oscillospiraceae bacterium]|nr:hypothetical protein [Oscillospiraceae bacterium]
MNLKKVMGGIAAVVMAASMMAVSANALSADKYVDERKPGSDYFVVVNSDDAKIAGWSKDSGIAASSVYGVRYYIDVKDPSQGYGGGIGINATSNNWESHEWGNDGAGKEITSDGKTVQFLSSKPAFKDDDAYANFFIQKWWGDFTVTKAELLDKDGNVLSVEEAPAAEEAAPAEEEAPAAAEEKKTEKKTEKKEEKKAEETKEEAPAAEAKEEKKAEKAASAASPLAAAEEFCKAKGFLIGSGSSDAWGQAVKLQTYNNLGEGEEVGDPRFDTALISPDKAIVAFYKSDSAPELILQSWSGGEGWAKVPANPDYSVDGLAVYTYDYMAAMYQSEDFKTVDCVYVGDTGMPLEVSGAYVVDVADVTAALAGGAAEEAPAAAEAVDVSVTAKLGFADYGWTYQDWDSSVTVTGDGTYTITSTAVAGAPDAGVFVIDLEEMFAKYPTAEATLDKIVIDGNEVSFDASKIVYGDVEEKGNFRIEVYNQYGTTKDDAGYKYDTPINESLELTFTVSGLNDAAASAAVAEEEEFFDDEEFIEEEEEIVEEEAPVETTAAAVADAPVEAAPAPKTGNVPVAAAASVMALAAVAAAATRKRK